MVSYFLVWSIQDPQKHSTQQQSPRWAASAAKQDLVEGRWADFLGLFLGGKLLVFHPINNWFLGP